MAFNQTNIGALVTCISATGALVQGQDYKITAVTPAGLAINVEGLTPRFQSSRFELKSEQTAEEIAQDEYSTWIIDEGLEGEIYADEFDGCCGAGMIYWADRKDLTPDRVKRIMEDTAFQGFNKAYGVYFSVLTPEQVEAGVGDALSANGFMKVAESMASDGLRTLTSYVFVAKPVD